METLQSAENLNIVFGALLAISELIALTPLKSNSIFQLLAGILGSLTGED